MRAGKNLLAVTLALAMLSPACGGGEEQPSTRVKPPRDCPRTYELCRALAAKDRPHSAAEREEEKGADAGAGGTHRPRRGAIGRSPLSGSPAKLARELRRFGPPPYTARERRSIARKFERELEARGLIPRSATAAEKKAFVRQLEREMKARGY